jgi:hypothetical protein
MITALMELVSSRDDAMIAFHASLVQNIGLKYEM